ncbi:Brefeldin A-inhibited guanine nucleotide-exchange protein 2 [Hibiscus syriacus]|uniref:Brefeldin A-inhibited guanine nucleotide-exchange protein 2 n=1 Tax=Hibiscus syriacus TaxID=106335 RepID=A0A6A2XQG5_HIBSY|nr:Brefeldin A-inhibited guanine nucleotide-exchange protein 2 [Hibiscus syriacus]
MVEVCWAPMLAAFSVPLDQSDDVVTSLCIEGFRRAIQFTAVMSMKTHRDAFVTSLAKFTSLHSPADIKQKNIDAIKFENLHLLGEGAPPDATFFAFSQNESEKSKQAKSPVLLVLKKGSGRIQHAASAVMRGSYDSAGIGGTIGTVTSEQMSNLVSNLNMLEQVGSAEMNRIFTCSQNLNSEAIIDFVRALCKVSMEELRSTSDPRVFSLTKIVEIAHYNMNRIRLVWSNIWLVLSDFFVTIGSSENLSIAIFAMDSLRQLSIKFLEREELANYNFQNEFMKPFVIAMQKTSAVEIRELFIRCVSQMVSSRVHHVKPGWKSIRDFSSSSQKGSNGRQENGELMDKDDHLYFWLPLLAGLSKLGFDPRTEIRESALQVLFEALRNHCHLFSLPLWGKVFESVLFPIFEYVCHAINPSGDDLPKQGIDGDMSETNQDVWLYESCTLALQLLVDLFANFYHTVNPLLRTVLSLLLSLIKRPHQSLAGIGIAAFARLMRNAGDHFLEEQWLEVVSSLKEAVNATLPDFSYFVSGDGMLEGNEHAPNEQSKEASHGSGSSRDDTESPRMRRLRASLSDAKCRAAVQLLLVQAAMEIYNMCRTRLSAKIILVLFDAMHDAASHAHEINNTAILRTKIQEFGHMTQMQDPPLLRLENESYQFCLTFLHNLISDRLPSFDEAEEESHLFDLCQEVLLLYIETASSEQTPETYPDGQTQWLVPLGSGKRKELAARAPLAVTTLRTICSLGDALFEKNITKFFPLLSSLISCEHGSNEVQLAVGDMLNSSVGPLLLQAC